MALALEVILLSGSSTTVRLQPDSTIHELQAHAQVHFGLGIHHLCSPQGVILHGPSTLAGAGLKAGK